MHAAYRICTNALTTSPRGPVRTQQANGAPVPPLARKAAAGGLWESEALYRENFFSACLFCCTTCTEKGPRHTFTATVSWFKKLCLPHVSETPQTSQQYLHVLQLRKTDWILRWATRIRQCGKMKDLQGALAAMEEAEAGWCVRGWGRHDLAF